MKFVLCLAVITMTAGLAGAAMAAGDPQPVATPPASATGPAAAIAGQPPVADPTTGLADIPENQAEREAVQRGELKLEQAAGSAPAPAIDPAREARRAAFDAVVAEQDAKVQALADRLDATTDGAAQLAIQKEIEREKLATGRRLLEVQLQFATRDGDQARIEQVQAALTAWDAPPPAGTPVDRPVPSNPSR